VSRGLESDSLVSDHIYFYVSNFGAVLLLNCK